MMRRPAHPMNTPQDLQPPEEKPVENSGVVPQSKFATFMGILVSAFFGGLVLTMASLFVGGCILMMPMCHQKWIGDKARSVLRTWDKEDVASLNEEISRMMSTAPKEDLRDVAEQELPQLLKKAGFTTARVSGGSFRRNAGDLRCGALRARM